MSGESVLNKVRLREARRGDESELWRLHMEALKATTPPQEIEATIAEFCPEPMDDVSALKHCAVVVAELDDQIIGFAGLNLETGFVFLMFVSPAFMRRGIGRRLLSHLEQMAAERSIRVLTLSSSVYAHRFYRASGFEGDELTKVTGRRTGVVFEEYLMCKEVRTR